MTKIILIVGVLAVLAGGIAYWQVGSGGYKASYSDPKTVVIGTPTTSTETETPRVKTYTMADIATHSDISSCWTTVSGNVYDVTSWITKHPSGQKAILGICGKDGTSAFTGKHGGQEKPEQTLATFKIGLLSQ